MNWVRCEDRMPNKYGYYLTYNELEDYKCWRVSCDVLKYDPKTGYFEKYYQLLDETHSKYVSHWMVIPEVVDG